MWTWMFTFAKSFKHNKIIQILIYFISEKKKEQMRQKNSYKK